MPAPKHLSKEDIVRAQKHTLSNRAAARYLNVSYNHYKRWAKLYQDEDKGKDLFDKHINQSGKGIPKFLTNGKKDPALMDIIEGRVDPSHFNADKIKYRLITEGYVEEQCGQCNFSERRVLDYKMPLLLNFKDKNKKNYRLDNIELLCYNHYFLFVGDIFSEKQVENIENHKSSNTGEVDWEVDSYHLERLKELGLGSEGPEDYDIISRK